jgi:hypothetical protein
MRSVTSIMRLARTVLRLAPEKPSQQPAVVDWSNVVVTQLTYERITVVTVEQAEIPGEPAQPLRPADDLPVLLAAGTRESRGRVLRALLRPQSRGGRLARAALLAAGMIALPVVARPVQRLLLGRREVPRLPRPEVPLLPPAPEE